MECPGLLLQLSILTAAVQLPFEKAGLLRKTTRRKATLAMKAQGVPTVTLHSPGCRDVTQSSFTSHRSMPLLASNVPCSRGWEVFKKSREPEISNFISIIERVIVKSLFYIYKIYDEEHTTCILDFLSALEINWEIRRYGVETSLRIYCITAFAAAVPEFVSQ